MKKAVSLIFIFFFGLITIQAQKVWTLEECINYALANNIQIKQSEIGIKNNKINLLQSKLNTLPSINGQTSHSVNYGNKFDIYTNQYTKGTVKNDNFSLNSNVVLFNGLQQINTIKQIWNEYTASKYDAKKMQNDISLAITGYYMQILYNKELLQIVRDQVEVTRQQVDRTKKMVEAGTLARGSLLDIQSQEAAEELNLINAKNQLDMSYLDLKQLLDLKTTNKFEIVEPKVNIVKENILTKPEKIFSYAVTSLPEIKSAEFKLKSSVKQLAIAKGMRSPSLTLGCSLTTRYSDANKELNSGPDFGEIIPFKNQIDDNYYKYIGLSLNIPIFNGYRTSSNISKAKLAKSNAEYDLQLKKNQLRKNIEQAYADALASLKKYEATLKSLKSFEESFHYTEQKFNVGMVNSLDYNISKNKLTKAKSDLLQAKYDYLYKTKVLDFYMGKPLVL